MVEYTIAPVGRSRRTSQLNQLTAEHSCTSGKSCVLFWQPHFKRSKERRWQAVALYSAYFTLREMISNGCSVNEHHLHRHVLKQGVHGLDTYQMGQAQCFLKIIHVFERQSKSNRERGDEREREREKEHTCKGFYLLFHIPIWVSHLWLGFSHKSLHCCLPSHRGAEQEVEKLD